jgi:hypothetical protein
VLRVGVVIDTFQQPAWIRRLLEVIQSSKLATISAVLMFEPRNTRLQHSIVGEWYSRLDALRFRQADDALALADVRPLPGDVPLRSADFSPEDAFDVIFCFSPAFIRDRVETSTSPMARLGVWWATDQGLADFAAAGPITTGELHVAAAADRPDGVIGCAHIGTDRISPHRALSGLYWKMERLFVRELEAAIENRDAVPSPAKPPAVPSNLQITRAAARALVRETVQKFRDSLMHEQWFIAFRFQTTDDHPATELTQMHTIIPPRDRLWADPFVVVEDGRAVVFVEEMTYREHRGGIACLELRRDGTWTSPRRILERPYHLSYPCVFRWRGDLYMVPESVENQTIELYRCVRFPDQWEFVQQLASGVSAADSTIFELNGLWWMYTSIRSVGRIFDELSLYYAESPLGPWQPHPLNPVQTNVAGGRCGGAPFIHRGAVYRAAQNGARRYGHSLQIRQIVSLTPEQWEEREVASILPDWRPGLKGTHTFNHADGVTVVDGLQYRWAI